MTWLEPQSRDYPPMSQTGTQRPREGEATCPGSGSQLVSKWAHPAPHRAPLPLLANVLRGLFILWLFSPSNLFLLYLFFYSLFPPAKSWISAGSKGGQVHCQKKNLKVTFLVNLSQDSCQMKWELSRLSRTHLHKEPTSLKREKMFIKLLSSSVDGGKAPQQYNLPIN